MIHPPVVQVVPVKSINDFIRKLSAKKYVCLGTERIDELSERSVDKQKHCLIEYKDFDKMVKLDVSIPVDVVYIDSTDYIILN